jgi:hypothetical protein
MIARIINSILPVLAGLFSALPTPARAAEPPRVYAPVLLASEDHPSEAANNTSIGIDRIDQRGNNLDRKYFYERTGMGVSVYVVDTGINLKHNDFGGRAIPLYDYQRSPTDPAFAEGIVDEHGTMVASQIASRTFGVAKNATIYSVRVTSAFNDGTVQNVVDGLETVRQHITGQNDGAVRRPSVVNLSLGFYCRNSSGQISSHGAISDFDRNRIEAKVQEIVNAGAVVVAGTDDDHVNTDFFTPARMGIRSASNGIITVGGTQAVDDGTSMDDSQYVWSGFPVEIHAPAGRDGVLLDNVTPVPKWWQRGLSINTTYGQGGFLKGNSAATPLVTGAVALFLENSGNLPAAQQPAPGTVEQAILNNRSVTPTGTNIVYTGCEFLPPYTENPILDTRWFVKQQYFDFLGRQPDDGGWNFWVGQVDGDPNCQVDREGCFGRVNTSRAFFESIELKSTTFFAYRLHRLTFNDFPNPEHGFTTRTNPRMERLLADARKIGRNVVVLFGNWQAQLEANQRAFVNEWVAGAEFQNLYPEGMNNTTLVQTLYANAQVPIDAVGQQAIQRLDNGEPRGTVLYDIVQSAQLASNDHTTHPDTVHNLWNPMYVLLCYFGYLRRNPDDTPNFNDLSGYNFWLNKLNDQTFVGGNPDLARNEMIRAFIVSIEYKERFFSDPHCDQPPPVPPPDPGDCSYSLSPTSQGFGSGDDSSSFSVNTPSGCSWSATSDSGWVTIISGSGTGGGSVLFSVIFNGSTSSRTGHITVGGQTFTVNQTAPPAQPGAKPADFDGDGISDWFIYRGGAWLYFGPGASGLHSAWTGASSSSCIPAPADYDGDGKVDLSLKCGGAWHFYNADGSYRKGIWTGGVAGDLPVPADYDGDGKADVVVFRGGAWLFFDYATGEYTGGVWTGPGYGTVPLPMDYDGDGRADFTVYQNGAWHFYNHDGTYFKGIWTGGVAGDIPVPGNYHGGGRDEVVVFRGGAWLFFNLDTASYTGGVWTGATPYGGQPLQPAPLDLDGDGTLEFTIYAGGPWHFYNDDGSYLRGVWTGGVADDKPISRRQL